MTLDPDTPWTGRLLGGRYLLGERLGTGGMGAVYSAVQQDLGRRVAIKVLLPHLAERPELITRFKREALAAAALGHPNIVQVTDFSDAKGEPPFIVMEQLEGETLGARLARETKLPAERVAFVAAQVLSALEATHGAGIIHRDLKPENIFLTSIEGVPDVVKVLDFGLAKHSQSQEPTLTETGALMGTPAYMAPEQVEGGSITPAADLYAVGAVMYRALSGRLPHTGENHYALMYAIVQQRPVSIATLRPDLDDQLAFIVDRSMEKRPADRFASARAMRVALSSLSPSAAGIAVPAPTSTLSPSADSAAPTVIAGHHLAGSDSAAPTMAGDAPPGPGRPAPAAVPGQAAVPLPAFGAGGRIPAPASTPAVVAVPTNQGSSGAGLKIVIAVLCTIIVMGGATAVWLFWPRGSGSETPSTEAVVAVVAAPDATREAAAEIVPAAAEAPSAPVTAQPIDAPPTTPVAPAPEDPADGGSAEAGGLFGGFDPFAKDDASDDPPTPPADLPVPTEEPATDPTPEGEPKADSDEADPSKKSGHKKKKNKKDNQGGDEAEPKDDAPDPMTATGGTKPYLSSINAGKVLKLDAVRGTLGPVLPKITRCYVKHQFSEGHHEFQGWRLHLEPDGNVSKVERLGTGERSKALDHCMNPIFRRANFGPTGIPEGGSITVTYTARLPWNP